MRFENEYFMSDVARQSHAEQTGRTADQAAILLDHFRPPLSSE
jgi:hypothetical protein